MAGLSVKFNRKIYDVRNRFGIKDYKGNIVSVEKKGMAIWLVVSILGKFLCIIWAVQAFGGNSVTLADWQVALLGLLMWGLGDFYATACHRGIIYHHVDMLAEYLDGRISNIGTPNKHMESDADARSASQSEAGIPE
jgi:hypothetical protein